MHCSFHFLSFKFQFHKGAIRTLAFDDVVCCDAHFNSIKVRLELPQKTSLKSAIRYFNSIKVRLEPAIFVSLSFSRPFQFHKGAIRTGGSGLLVLDDLPFQFHKGAIRTTDSSLEHSAERLFQFHKGAIRTPSLSRQSAGCHISIP